MEWAQALPGIGTINFQRRDFPGVKGLYVQTADDLVFIRHFVPPGPTQG